jgi:hypothetical protein
MLAIMFFWFFAVLGIELSASSILGKHSITQPQPQPQPQPSCWLFRTWQFGHSAAALEN